MSKEKKGPIRRNLLLPIQTVAVVPDRWQGAHGLKTPEDWMEWFREESCTNGNRLAIQWAVEYCSDHQHTPPIWLMEVLAQEFNGGGLKWTSLKGGRHSNPHTKLEEDRKGELLFHAVVAAEKEGYSGENRYKVASLILQLLIGETYTVESIPKTLAKIKKPTRFPGGRFMGLLFAGGWKKETLNHKTLREEFEAIPAPTPKETP